MDTEESNEQNIFHPLLVPSILHSVLDTIPPSCLEPCRLVCKTWNQEACRISRKKIPVILELTKMGNHLPKTSLAFTKYMLKMEATTDFPHAHFEFRKIRPHHRNLFNPTNSIMQRFLDKFGSHVKFLHVDILYPDFQFAELLLAVRDRMPNVETLSFTFHTFDHEDVVLGVSGFQLPKIKHFNVEVSRIREEDYLVRLLPNLLALMPNVTWVSSACNSLNPYAENPNTMEGILRSITGGFANNLTKIDVKLKLGDEDILELVSKIYFQPKSMIITFDGEIISSNFISLMLKISKTLETLTIKTPNPQVCTLDAFPGRRNIKMDKLRRLNLSSCFCGPLTSLKNIPNLEHLNLTNLDLGDVFPFISSEQYDHPLKTLDITDCTNQSPPIIKTISTSFTHLKTLSFDATDLTIRIIYEKLPQLEELNIAGDNLTELTDYGICGITKDEPGEGNAPENLNPGVQPMPEEIYNISALKNLTSLKMECNNLTDAAVLHGIVHCSNLRNLTLGSPLISEEALDAVSNLRRLKMLNITLCTHPSIEFNLLLRVQKNILSNDGVLVIDDGRPGYRESYY